MLPSPGGREIGGEGSTVGQQARDGRAVVFRIRNPGVQYPNAETSLPSCDRAARRVELRR